MLIEVKDGPFAKALEENISKQTRIKIFLNNINLFLY